MKLNAELKDGQITCITDTGLQVPSPKLWTTTSLERALETKKFRKMSKHNKKHPVETSKIPPFNEGIIMYMFAAAEPPSIDEFQKFYLNSYFNDNGDDTVTLKTEFKRDYNFKGKKTGNKKAVMDRAGIAYSSIIRDIHMTLMLTEHPAFTDVLYSLVNDRNGIDVEFTFKDKKYKLRLAVKTKRSDQFIEKKNLNRHDYSGDEITLLFDLSDSRNIKIGKGSDKLLLYGQHHVQQLLSELGRKSNG